MKEGERGPFFPKLRVRIKDNNSSPHGKFYRFLCPFSSKFFRPKLRLICSLYLPTHSEPGLPVARVATLVTNFGDKLKAARIAYFKRPGHYKQRFLL